MRNISRCGFKPLPGQALPAELCDPGMAELDRQLHELDLRYPPSTPLEEDELEDRR